MPVGFFTGISSPAEAKERFRSLAAELHPDKNPDDRGATAKFQRMQTEYQKCLERLELQRQKSLPVVVEKPKRKPAVRRPAKPKAPEPSNVPAVIQQAVRRDLQGEIQNKVGDLVLAGFDWLIGQLRE